MASENEFLLQAFFTGVYITFVYDVLRIVRRVISHGELMVSLEDLVFWIYCADRVFLLMYYESNGTLRWFAHVKSVFAERWPFFFRRVDADIEEMDIDLMGAMDAQIRALTEGDITKEETIKQLPCWRALTELNQKAREAKEFHEKYDRK